MKKKGPHRSQSLKALSGSSRKGLGKTTSFRLLTILERSLFTVSHTGSVRVLGGDPNPEAPILTVVGGGGGGAWGTGLGRLEGMKGEEETGIEARGGLGGRAGRTVAELAFIRFSISSISDCDDGCSGTVSPYPDDIFFFLSLGFKIWVLFIIYTHLL